ncbi:unnamed protein product [Scytosiphon promiscuus]
MDDHSAAIFRARYDSLKCTFEARLASLAAAIRSAVENTRQDEVLLQLSSSENTREFAPAHARALIKRHLGSERDNFFHGLAARLADAEAKVTQHGRRNEELESTVALLRGDAARKEQGRAGAIAVDADIRQLRQEYQISLEASTEKCRQLKAELSRAKQRSGELAVERDEQAAQTRSLQQATVDAKVKALEILSLERELGKEKSANMKMSSELEQTQRKLDGLATNHQNLQLQARAMRHILCRFFDRRLQLADVNRKKNEAQFRETVTRMESLMEQEGRENVSAIKSLREKTESAKDKLSTEIERQGVVNRQLTNGLTAAKAKTVELELRLQAALKGKETDASSAAAREAMLHAEVEQARARADTMSQTLAEAVREQAGLVTETANAKVAAQILEEKSRAAEVKMARAAGRETGRAEALPQERILSTAPFPRWEVDTLLAEKLQEASNHISELRTVLRQEVRRREAAEADVSEAQGYLNSSRHELGELRQLAWKLEQMGRNSIAEIDEKKMVTRPLEEVLHTPAGAGEREERKLTEKTGTPERGTAHRGRRHHGQQCSPKDWGNETEGRRGINEAEENGPKLYAMQLTMPQAVSSTKVGLAALLTRLSELRSELRCVKAQLVETDTNSQELLRDCNEELGLRVQALAQSLQQACREKAEARRQTVEATTAGARHKQTADTLARVVQGISTILRDSLGVGVPASLTDADVAGKEAEGMLKRGLSALASDVTNAVSSATGSIKQSLLVESHHDSPASTDGQRRSPTLDGMIWAERSKNDFNMLAQLQKIEAESEVQSLQARLDDMAAKYSRAVAEKGTVDSEPLREERERAKEELARAARAHGGVVSALEAALTAEKSHCQDLRTRLERQTRQHEAALGEGEQRLLSTQQELDKAQQTLEHTKFALERETARRARLEKKYRELEDRGLVSPRSVSPRSVSPRVWRSEITRRKVLEEQQTGEVVQPMQPRPSSARLVLEEARAKLGQDGDALCVSRDRPGDRVVRQGEPLASSEPTQEGDSVGGSKDGPDQSVPASVSPL